MAGKHTRWVFLVVMVAAGFALRGAPARSVVPSASFEPRSGLTFDASVDPASRAAIEAAIASARPEAQALIAKVAGYATVKIGLPEGGALGSAGGPVGGPFDVILNVGETERTVGGRGVTRLVLHELGHVVDYVLVDDALAEELDAMIPAGVPCPAGTQLGSCAPVAERFAETFAKWAMGNDLGANLYIGYSVPPPSVGFDAWAAPLAELD